MLIRVKPIKNIHAISEESTISSALIKPEYETVYFNLRTMSSYAGKLVEISCIRDDYIVLTEEVDFVLAPWMIEIEDVIKHKLI